MNRELTQTDELGLMYDRRKFQYEAEPRTENDADDRPRHEPAVRFLTEVPYRPMEWIWDQRIPENKLTLIAGPPQSGKSLVALDLAVRITRAIPMPGETGEACGFESVIMMTRHENLHDTLLPRIRRAGGDPSQFSQFSQIGRMLEPQERFYDLRKLRLPADFAYLEEGVDLSGAMMLVVDPLSCYCRSGRDLEDTIELLDDLASRMSIPILATVAARTGRDPRGGWVSQPELADAPARCIWSIIVDPDDADRRLFVNTRMTFATPGTGMAFRCEGGRVAWEPLPAPKIAAEDEPVLWLWQLLQEGEQRGSDIKRLAGEYGISQKMLRRACTRLGVQFRRDGFGAGAAVCWQLPADQLFPIPTLLEHLSVAAKPAARLVQGEGVQT